MHFARPICSTTIVSSYKLGSKYYICVCIIWYRYRCKIYLYISVKMLQVTKRYPFQMVKFSSSSYHQKDNYVPDGYHHNGFMATLSLWTQDVCLHIAQKDCIVKSPECSKCDQWAMYSVNSERRAKEALHPIAENAQAYILYIYICLHLPTDCFMKISLQSMGRYIYAVYVYVCLDTCSSHFLTIIEGVDLILGMNPYCLYARPGD